MAEEMQLDNEAKQQIGDASIKQIEMITKMVKEYAKALNNGSLNSTEMYILGSNVIMAGLQLISRSHDMDGLDVDTRIASTKAMQSIINGVIEKVYANPTTVAGMVAKTAMHNLKAKGLGKNIKE